MSIFYNIRLDELFAPRGGGGGGSSDSGGDDAGDISADDGSYGGAGKTKSQYAAEQAAAAAAEANATSWSFDSAGNLRSQSGTGGSYSSESEAKAVADQTATAVNDFFAWSPNADPAWGGPTGSYEATGGRSLAETDALLGMAGLSAADKSRLEETKAEIQEFAEVDKWESMFRDETPGVDFSQLDEVNATMQDEMSPDQMGVDFSALGDLTSWEDKGTPASGPAGSKAWDDPDTKYYDESKGEGPDGFFDKLFSKDSIVSFLGTLSSTFNPFMAFGVALGSAALKEFRETAYAKADDMRVAKAEEAFAKAARGVQALTEEDQAMIAEVTKNVSPSTANALTSWSNSDFGRDGNGDTEYTDIANEYASSVQSAQDAGNIVYDANSGTLDTPGENKSLAQRQYEDTRNDLAPWREAGQSALRNLAAKIQEGPGDYFDSDIHKMRMETGDQLVDSSKVVEPTANQAKALQDYGKDYSSTGYDNFLTRYYNSLNPLQSLAGVGQAAVKNSATVGNKFANTESNDILTAARERGSGYILDANNANARNIAKIKSENKALQDIGSLIAGL